jgi:hypothetical protein
MATLITLQNFINNIKQTPSGKVEWSDVSLKGLEEEVLNLFSTNAFQLALTTTNLQTLSGVDSQLAVVQADSDVTKNGLYFWAATQVVIGFNYPATGGGFWNYIKNSTTAPVSQIIAGTNITVSPVGGTGTVTVSAPNVGATNPTNFFVPVRINAGQYADSPIKWDTTLFPELSTRYLGQAKGFYFAYNIDQYIFGGITNKIEFNGSNFLYSTINSVQQGLYFETANDVFLLGGGQSGGPNSASSIGVWQPNTPANTSMFVGNSITVASNASTLSGRKIKVFIPTVGYKYIQLYDN